MSALVRDAIRRSQREREAAMHCVARCPHVPASPTTLALRLTALSRCLVLRTSVHMSLAVLHPLGEVVGVVGAIDEVQRHDVYRGGGSTRGIEVNMLGDLCFM